MGNYLGKFQYIDPYAPLNESVITSNVISTRYAHDLTMSVYTVGTGSDTTSRYTWQISNASGNPQHSTLGSGNTPSTLGIPEAAWSDFTARTVSDATTLDPPLGYRWARIIRRNASAASLQFEINRQERQ